MGPAGVERWPVLRWREKAPVTPPSFVDPLRPIPATIAAELGEAPAGGAHYQALFLLGVMLFFMTLLINLSVEYISSLNQSKTR